MDVHILNNLDLSDWDCQAKIRNNIYIDYYNFYLDVGLLGSRSLARGDATGEYRESKEKARPMKYQDTACEQCGKIMSYNKWREKHPKANNWRLKRFCSFKCWKKHSQKNYRECINCNNMFLVRFRKQKCCSKDCALEYTWISQLAKRVGLTYQELREELIKIANRKQG